VVPAIHSRLPDRGTMTPMPTLGHGMRCCASLIATADGHLRHQQIKISAVTAFAMVAAYFCRE
jgi:hypothetical protein